MFPDILIRLVQLNRNRCLLNPTSWIMVVKISGENFDGGDADDDRSRAVMSLNKGSVIMSEQSEPSRAIQFSARRSASEAEPLLVAHERVKVSARSYARNARLARNNARFRSAHCQPCIEL